MPRDCTRRGPRSTFLEDSNRLTYPQLLRRNLAGAAANQGESQAKARWNKVYSFGMEMKAVVEQKNNKGQAGAFFKN